MDFYKPPKRPKGEPRPVGLYLDTCVWLDLVEKHINEPLLTALESLCHQHVIDLIVPQIVRDEFTRNKDRAVQNRGRSLSGTLKQARVALYAYGDPKKRKKVVEAIDDIDHRLTGSAEVAADAVARIEKLFRDAIHVHANDKAVLAASNRAMEKKAPFHNGKNSFADAVLIELYGQNVSRPQDARYVFVTHNTKDFSAPNADTRLPHPDIAAYFTKIKSRYFTRLIDALRAVRPREFREAMYEDDVSMEPRKASEVSDAITELIDRVWYDRHMASMQKLEAGKMKVLPRKQFGPEHYQASGRGDLITDDILAGARKAARRLEKKYGKENLGPYSKFDWGMINGKLSALRWVFGEDWDELYT